MGQGEADLKSKCGVSPTCMETSVVSDIVIIQGDWFIWGGGRERHSFSPAFPASLGFCLGDKCAGEGAWWDHAPDGRNALGPSTQFTAGSRLLRILQKLQSQSWELLVGGFTTFLGASEKTACHWVLSRMSLFSL